MADSSQRNAALSAGGAAPDLQRLKEAIAGRGLLIGVDGASGSGKSTVSKAAAKALGLSFLETGAMYRALTWFALEEGVDIEDPDALAQAAERLDFRSEGTVDQPMFFVGDEDVTEALRSDKVASVVSTVASYPVVRQWMTSAQRDQMLAAKRSGRGMVAEGRDITTVVCPDADVPVLLKADPTERLRRRVLETHGEVTEDLMAEMAELVYGRDEQDSKVTQFLDPAEGVTVIDSTGLSIEGVLSRLYELVAEKVQSAVDPREVE